jgi:hypothetical protein
MPAYHLPRFNPFPRIESVEIGPQQFAYVVDDALLNPDQLVDLATLYPERMRRPEGGGFPGIEWGMPAEFAGRLDDFFRLHVRRLLSGRRMLSMSCRMAMVSLAPPELVPRQWICHRDADDVPADQSVAASVLYLFRDSALGGTSFYRPRRPPQETDQLLRDAVAMDGPSFARRYGMEPGYMVGSNDFFECVNRVPARWNRMVFYDGTVFHAGDIGQPGRLSADPRTGRLTLNGLFNCVRAR